MSTVKKSKTKEKTYFQNLHTCKTLYLQSKGECYIAVLTAPVNGNLKEENLLFLRFVFFGQIGEILYCIFKC